MAFIQQYYLGDLAHASYLIADERSGLAAVVDPSRDVDPYVEDARRAGFTIGHVFLTHLHADFVAGHLELREKMGATIHLGRRAQVEYPFAPMSDGETLTLGDVRLVTLETPGHSPESICLLVYDVERGELPYAVLTGDTLLIGDVGRPDLRASLGWSAERLAGELYDSLHDKLARLPAETLVYPAHGAGSLCATSLSPETVSTIGAQRAQNRGLRPMSREAFVEMVTRDVPEAPPYFTYDALLNSRERPTLEQSLERALRPINLEEVLALAGHGAQLLDTRAPAEFDRAHLKGSVNVALDGSFATWAGTVLDPNRPIVVIANPARELEAVKGLTRIGFDAVAGYLDGGVDRAGDRPQLLDRIDRVDATWLAERLTSPDPPLLVDVRTPMEWREGRVEHAVNVPLSRLTARLAELPNDRDIVVYCATGYRSAIAASLLRRAGFRRVADLAGGYAGQALVGQGSGPGCAMTGNSDQAVAGGERDGGGS